MIPERLRWWGGTPAGAAWLERLPGLVADCAAAWELDVGPPFHGFAAYTAPATRRDGRAVVLKLNFPEPETEHEAAALAHWDGRGAVRLLAHDPARAALLLERVLPGDHLPAAAVEAVVPDLLAELWSAPRPDHGFETLRDAAERWADAIPAAWEAAGRPFERALVDEALGHLRELAPAQPEALLVNQDLHAANVLRATRAPWLVIDPKPLLGERAIDLVGLARNRPERRHLERLAAATDVDPERARGWALVHALAWGYQRGRWLPTHLAVARALARP